VALTFPPPRDLNLDFLDNFRTKPPCGVPKGAATTTLVPGSTINVTWHLGYPHRGGFKIELLDAKEAVVEVLPGGGGDGKDGFKDDDVTQQYAQVTLPDNECVNCSIRLVRQASEWGGRYRFWSCADINISNKKDGLSCGEGGLPSEGGCKCKKRYFGDSCGLKEECNDDSDCGGKNRGECVLPDGTRLPRMPRVCYCRPGFFGTACEKDSPLRDRLDDMAGYRTRIINDDISLHWRKVEDKPEVEIAVRGRTASYVAVGWRSSKATKLCKQTFTGLQQRAEQTKQFAPKGGG